MRNLILAFLLSSIAFVAQAQSTYKSGSTEYYYGQYYSTTGKPMVKRSEANKAAFLRSEGYTSVPHGYEVDHIVPLSKGGSDDPSNMQLLTKEQHARKTARERASHSNSSGYAAPSYRSSTTTPAYSTPNSTGRVIQTGPRGGQYYINKNGNKIYIKKK